MKVNTAIIIDKRKALKNGKYSVKLRVTYARKQQYYVTKHSLTEEEFLAVCSKKAKGELKTIQLELSSLEQAANKVINSIEHFDFITFKRQMFRSASGTGLFDCYGKYIYSLTKDGQIGTASNYTCSMNSLKKFRPQLSFYDVNADLLKAYEKWLLAEGKSISTVGIYLRPLRAIIKMAMADGILDSRYRYPFGTKSAGKYQIPTSRNIKKALSLEEIKMIYFHQAPENSWEDKARDFWMFSYLANGMNITDIAKLRFSNIEGGYIIFVRSKTQRSSQTVTPIVVPLIDDIIKIIGKWGGDAEEPRNFIFSIIKDTDTPAKQRADVQQFTKMMNKYMKIIARKLGINKPITSYYARHSFSTVLKRSGADIEFISEALGHSSISTTRAYLDSFEKEKKKEMAKLLTSFD